MMNMTILKESPDDFADCVTMPDCTATDEAAKETEISNYIRLMVQDRQTDFRIPLCHITTVENNAAIIAEKGYKVFAISKGELESRHEFLFKKI